MYKNLIWKIAFTEPFDVFRRQSNWADDGIHHFVDAVDDLGKIAPELLACASYRELSVQGGLDQVLNFLQHLPECGSHLLKCNCQNIIV